MKPDKSDHRLNRRRFFQSAATLECHGYESMARFRHWCSHKGPGCESAAGEAGGYICYYS